MADFSCLGCGHTWRSMAAFVRDGGHVRGLGLALMAKCPDCGETFGSNAGWEKTKEIDLREDGKTSKRRRLLGC